MKFFMKQVPMRRVVYATTPIYAWATWLYGWRIWAVLLAVLFGSVLTEWFFTKRKEKSPVSEAVFVTSFLLALSMPPLVPLWIAFTAGVVGILLGKVVYGGFGRNVFNPAIVGRLFVYLSFPVQMQTTWVAPGNWGMSTVDKIASPTPLLMMQNGESLSWMDLFFGLGDRIGTMGESSIFLIILGGLYLIFKKTANWRLMLSPIVGYLALGYLLYSLGVSGVVDPIMGLFAGSFLFVCVFMATEPVTAPNKKGAQWIYGIMIGVIVVLIRLGNNFPEGVSFAIIIANSFASLIDRWFTPKKKEAKK